MPQPTKQDFWDFQPGLWRRFLIWALLAVPTGSCFAKPEWRFIEGRPYVSQQDLASHFGIESFHDEKRGRLLLEGQGRYALFLPGVSYAVIEGRFQRLLAPVIFEGAGLYVSAATLQSHLLPFVNPAARPLLRAELRRALAKREGTSCALDREVKKIFLDPGHGGSDRGAVRLGIHEKDVVLQFTKVVAQELGRRGFQVMLSRKSDESVALDLRPQLAREWGADIFISIHANTSPFPGARGAETYILSSDATDAEARKLAVSENEAMTRRQKGPQMTLENILWDIGQTAYLQDSAHLASRIQTSLFQGANEYFTKISHERAWKNRGVREAPFLVLSHASMPAVLVELAYLSNVKDRGLLTSRSFQTVLGKALVDGIQSFADFCQPESGSGRNPSSRSRK